jgi:hypothetical protein
VSERIEQIRAAVELHANCQATHIQSLHVKERFNARNVWEGVVEVFAIDGNPEAKQAYGWQTKNDNGGSDTTVVLGVPPVNSAQAAVRAAIVAQARRQH